MKVNLLDTLISAERFIRSIAGPNRRARRRARWVNAVGVPTLKHGMKARTGKSGAGKVDRIEKRKRKTAEASRRRNRR